MEANSDGDRDELPLLGFRVVAGSCQVEQLPLQKGVTVTRQRNSRRSHGQSQWINIGLPEQGWNSGGFGGVESKVIRSTSGGSSQTSVSSDLTCVTRSPLHALGSPSIIYPGRVSDGSDTEMTPFRVFFRHEAAAQPHSQVEVEVFQLDGTYLGKWNTLCEPAATSLASQNFSIGNSNGTTSTAGAVHSAPFSSSSSSAFPTYTFCRDMVVHPHLDLVFVSDNEDHCIRVYSKSGRSISRFGNEGSEEGEFEYPFGLCVWNDQLFVADSGNKRVQIFGINGTFVKAIQVQECKEFEPWNGFTGVQVVCNGGIKSDATIASKPLDHSAATEPTASSASSECLLYLCGGGMGSTICVVDFDGVTRFRIASNTPASISKRDHWYSAIQISADYLHAISVSSTNGAPFPSFKTDQVGSEAVKREQ